ncbi:MAG TPA: response regulator [Actinomycetota bacterium]|nr:response regulator [Actinomycetota bacterium]
MNAERALRLLLVTDNDSVGHQMRYGFPANVEVDFAREARDAWQRLEEYVPAAVIVDLQTGSAGGFALATDMRGANRLARVPVVMLIDRYQDDWLARQAGARAVLVKPIDAGELLTTITRLLSEPPAA